jgi:hypothetical protein
MKADPNIKATRPSPDLDTGWFATAALWVEVEVEVPEVPEDVEEVLVAAAVAVAFCREVLQKTSW